MSRFPFIMHMAVILITFSSPRLNLINSVNGHSKSHSFYFPKESVHWNPPIFNESDDSGAPGHGWNAAKRTHYVTQSKHTNKSSHSNLKAICGRRPTSSQRQNTKCYPRTNLFCLNELPLVKWHRAAIESCEKQLHHLQGI